MILFGSVKQTHVELSKSINFNTDHSLLFVSLPQVTGISLSPGKDQLVILHLLGNNDIVLCLTPANGEDRAPELVGVLCHQFMQ